jgi:parvulin-like peptidyl-prolyl isomerase
MVRNKIAQEIVISPKRIERLYNQDQEKYRVGERAKFRMIVVEASRHARGEPRKIAEQVLVKARAGEDFAKLANEFSDDARITKGGDRGWIEDKETSLAKELKTVVFSLQAGQVSDVIELGGTAFVIKVEERKPAQIKPITEVRLAIEKQLRDQERDRLQTAWLKRLRKKAFIAYF